MAFAYDAGNQTIDITGTETIQTFFSSTLNNPTGDVGTYLDRFGSSAGGLEYYYYVLKTATNIDVNSGADFTITDGALIIPDPGVDVDQFVCSGTTTIGVVSTDPDSRDPAALICQRRLASGSFNASEGFFVTGTLNLYGRIHVSATSRCQSTSTFGGKNGTIHVIHDGTAGDENVQVRFLGTNNHDGLNFFRSHDIRDSAFTGKVLLNNGTDFSNMTNFNLRAGLEMSNIQSQKLITDFFAEFFQFFSSGAGFTSYVEMRNFQNPDIAVPADIDTNRQGMVFINYDGTVEVSEADAYYYFKDTDSGNRPSTNANGFDSNVSADAQASGTDFTLAVPYRLIHQTASSAAVSDIRTPYRGIVAKYGFVLSVQSFAPKSAFTQGVDLLSDPSITEATEATVAAYAGWALATGTPGKVTISSTFPTSIDALYDRAQYHKIQNLSDEFPSFTGQIYSANGEEILTNGISLNIAGYASTFVAGTTFSSVRVNGLLEIGAGTTDATVFNFVGATVDNTSASTATLIIGQGEQADITTTSTGGGAITLQNKTTITVNFTGPTQTYIFIVGGGAVINTGDVGLHNTGYSYDYFYTAGSAPAITIKVRRQGYTQFSTSATGNVDTIEVNATLLQRTVPGSSDPLYTGTTSADVSVVIDAADAAHKIDIGNSSVLAQVIYDEVQDALVTETGALTENLVGEYFPTDLGKFLFLNAFEQLRRATAGDANAGVQAIVSQANDTPVDSANGDVALQQIVGTASPQQIRDAMALALSVGVTPVADSIDNLLDVIDTVADAIQAKTDQLAFTDGDVHATLDGETVTVATINGDVINAASIATDAVTKIQSGLSTLTEAQVNAQVDTALSDYDGPTRAEATADKNEILAQGNSAWLTATTVIASNMRGTDGALTDKDGFTLSASGIQAIWNALTSALTTAGSIGKLLVDNVNATIASRSTFDPGSQEVTTDTVSRDASKADISGLSTFDPASDTVARVTLVDTVTANTDMRGTDGANTVAPDNAGITAIQGHTRPMAKQLGLVSGVTATHSDSAIVVSDGDGSTTITDNGNDTFTVESV